jgi:uncharacterized damage-inducible protein DinB
MTEFISEWTDDMKNQTIRLRTIFDTLTIDQLNQKPAPDKWSIGEIIDHLITSNKSYFKDFSAIGNGTYTNVRGIYWKVIPKLLGRMITRSITPITTKKYRTVKAFKPTQSNHTLSVQGEFEIAQDELLKLVDAFKGLDLDKTYIKSPASGLIIYSLHDALTIILNHEKRHIGQIEGLLSESR